MVTKHKLSASSKFYHRLGWVIIIRTDSWFALTKPALLLDNKRPFLRVTSREGLRGGLRGLQLSAVCRFGTHLPGGSVESVREPAVFFGNRPVPFRFLAPVAIAFS